MLTISLPSRHFAPSALEELYALSPRALPWAFAFRAFGAEKSTFWVKPIDSPATAAGTDLKYSVFRRFVVISPSVTRGLNPWNHSKGLRNASESQFGCTPGPVNRTGNPNCGIEGPKSHSPGRICGVEGSKCHAPGPKCRTPGPVYGIEGPKSRNGNSGYGRERLGRDRLGPKDEPLLWELVSGGLLKKFL